MGYPESATPSCLWPCRPFGGGCRRGRGRPFGGGCLSYGHPRGRAEPVTCRCARGACTQASSRAAAGLPPAPPGFCECAAFGRHLLGILDPADELVAGQRGDVAPGTSAAELARSASRRSTGSLCTTPPVVNTFTAAINRNNTNNLSYFSYGTNVAAEYGITGVLLYPRYLRSSDAKLFGRFADFRSQ